jgi:hypothetical protein
MKQFLADMAGIALLLITAILVMFIGYGLNIV